MRFSKRETKPNVGLLPVPVLQLLGSSSSLVKATSAESEKRESTRPAVTVSRFLQGTLMLWLSSVALAPLQIGAGGAKGSLALLLDGTDRQRITTVLFDR